MESIGRIKEKLKEASYEQLPALLLEYREDGRAGVAKLVGQYEKRLSGYKEELLRLEAMHAYENQYQMVSYVCGIDEAGRGPLAGPVVAGAVILPRDDGILYLDDSKKLSGRMRDVLYDEIYEKAVSVGVGIVSQEIIDKINILNATYQAMREAVAKLSVTPDVLLNDAVTIPEIKISQVPIIKGDQKSVSIAAASIIAKVTRDRLMTEYAREYPGYGFEKHKGYGTRDHYEAIQKLGLCRLHRKTFLKDYVTDGPHFQ